jgi:hypothetical protein
MILISSYLDNEALTPILKDLIIKSSLPLASLDGYSIAVDSTWFAGSRFMRRNESDFRGQSEPRLVKLHLRVIPGPMSSLRRLLLTEIATMAPSYRSCST